MPSRKGSKNKPKPEPPSPTALRIAALDKLLQAATDPVIACRIAEQIRLIEKAARPKGTAGRPKGISPESQRGRQIANHIENERLRREQAQEELAEYRNRQNARLPIPVVSQPVADERTAKGTSEPTPVSPAPQRPVKASVSTPDNVTPDLTPEQRVAYDEYMARQADVLARCKAETYDDTVTPPMKLGTKPCSPEVFERLREMSSKI